jgi:hypothetical protein
MVIRLDKEYIAIINENLPGNISGDGHFLFNKKQYHDLHPDLVYDRFFLFNEQENKINGQISFEQEHKARVSIARGAFGSVELNFRADYSVLSGFLKTIVDYFRERQVQSITIRHYPDFYDIANSPVICSVLSHLGFRVKSIDINHHISTENILFSALINKMEQRQLLKCMENGLKVKQGNAGEAERIYERISAFRKARNIPLTYSQQDFKNCLVKMPGHYSVFYVTDTEQEIIAAALAVRVTDSVLYYFFPADTTDRKSFSPMLPLMNGIYSHAKENNYSVIDLGVSSVNGNPQRGLINFKENIGGKPSARLTFVLEF